MRERGIDAVSSERRQLQRHVLDARAARRRTTRATAAISGRAICSRAGRCPGATKESRGCLLERTWRGTEPLELPTGETRAFLGDGDEVVMRGYCERPGVASHRLR